MPHALDWAEAESTKLDMSSVAGDGADPHLSGF